MTREIIWQNEALLQAQDLQAAHRLIETVSPTYRIEQEPNRVVLIQQTNEGDTLEAWILPEGNCKRAVKAVLAAEGDYAPQTEAERLALHTLFKVLEVPEDED